MQQLNAQKNKYKPIIQNSNPSESENHFQKKVEDSIENDTITISKSENMAENIEMQDIEINIEDELDITEKGSHQSGDSIEKQQQQSLYQRQKQSQNDQKSNQKYQIQEQKPEKPKIEVFLNVYDLTRCNKLLNLCCIGAYHTGVVIKDLEYSYGSRSGICQYEVKKAAHVFYKRTHKIGETEMDHYSIKKMLWDMSQEEKFKNNKYNLFDFNCNQVTDLICKKLTKNGIPGYLNRIARCLSCFQCCLPGKLIRGEYAP